MPGDFASRELSAHCTGQFLKQADEVGAVYDALTLLFRMPAHMKNRNDKNHPLSFVNGK
jgi:hypothetical protein